MYKTVKIGNQEWMAENLNVSHYRNGDAISSEQDINKREPKKDVKKDRKKNGKNDEWENSSTGTWYYYDDDSENGKTYGKLYNWDAVNDPRGLAPEGWHIPTDAEWKELEDSLGGYLVAGGKLKAFTFWNSPNLGATNDIDFNALPGGIWNYEFSGIGNYGYFWTASEGNHDDAWLRIIYFDNIDMYRTFNSKGNGLSVRCVRDSQDVDEYDNMGNYGKKNNLIYEEDFNLLTYITKEFDFIKTNKIKTIKKGDKKECYNINGELTKIEYGQDNVWGAVNIFKINDRYFYNVYYYDNETRNSQTYFQNNYFQMSRNFFIYKEWPDRETLDWEDFILNNDKIEVVYCNFSEQRYFDLYVYNNDGKIDNINRYSIDYEYNGSQKNPSENSKITSNNNPSPLLISTKIYNYDDAGKLKSIDINDLKENKTNTRTFEYNERGLITKTENGEDIEYEYYDD
ncbi:MAG: fibrobacter succinogenes major paralogous domain-containing protein [Ignavibacteriae bacterium]|nr:fibrobacter succinogenes major paralogous domain-containing protein [Ignavibacteriota bacterium]